MIKSFRELKTVAIALGVLLICLGVYYFAFLNGRCFFWEDVMYMTYPELNHLATSLASGHFPLWLSGLRDGMPFFGQQWAYYPPAWLLSFFVKDGRLPSLAIQWYHVSHLLFGAMGMCLFLRENKLRLQACIAGMIVFIFSAFPSLHIIHGAMGYVYMWLPLELFFAKKVIEGSRPGRNYIYLILAVWISFLAGFPQCVLYNAYFMVAYWLYLYCNKERAEGIRLLPGSLSAVAREFAKITGIFVMMILLGAFLLLSTAQNWSMSERQNYGFDRIADLSLPWRYLIDGLIPNFFGVSNGDGSGIPFWGVNRDTYEFRTWHAGGWLYWDYGFYAGQLALLAITVFAFNVRRLWTERREIVFFLAAVPLVLWLALGRYGGLYNIFYHIAPGFSMFRAPTRIGCLFDFSAAVLAAFLVDAVMRGNPVLKLRRPLWTLGVLYSAIFFGILVYGGNVFPELNDARLLQNSLTQVGVSAGICAVMAIILVRISATIVPSPKGKGKGACSALIEPEVSTGWVPRVLVWALVALTFFDLYLAYHQFHQGRINPEEYYADRNGLLGQMTKLREQQGPFRFAQLRDGKISEEIVFPRNTGYLYPGYEVMEGYVLFNLKEYGGFNSITNERVRLDIQNIGVVANLDSRTRQIGLMRYTNSLPRAKFYSDIRVYNDAKALYDDLDAGRLDYHRTLGVLREECVKYNVAIPSPAVNAQSQIHFTPVNSDGYQISYQTTAPGIIFISESFYPGWRAGDGHYPIIHAFGAFKGIVIPEAGNGVITVRFSPQVLWIGLAVSGVTLGVLLLLLLIGKWRSKRCLSGMD